MLMLAIDTSGSICTIAFGDENGILAEYHFYHKLNLLQRIMQVIDKIITDIDKKIDDIDGIVVSLGPGSFTGLRIGITTAKMLAFTIDKPIVGVGTLDAIAYTQSQSQSDVICSMIHARKGEVYYGLFDKSGSSLEECGVIEIDALLGKLEKYKNICFCGSGADVNSEELVKMFPTAFVAPKYLSFARGGAIIDMGIKKLNVGECDNPATLVPLYLKKPTPVVRLEEKEKEIS